MAIIFFHVQFHPEVQSAEPLSVDVSPASAVASEKPASPKGQALGHLQTSAFEPVIEEVKDSSLATKADSQEATSTKASSKATKVSVRHGKVFGVSHFYFAEALAKLNTLHT
jgi:hypothetical protein